MNISISGVQPFTLLDFPEVIAAIAFLPGCNLRCGFCHNPEFVLPERIKELEDSFIRVSSFLTFLESRKGLLEGVVISGGEPTIWKDLPIFIKEIKEAGFLVKLDTNGTRPDVIKDLLSKDLLDYVAVDLKASLTGYKSLVGQVNVSKIEETIKLLQQSSIEYEFRSTLIKELHSVDELKEMARLLSGSKRFYLQTFRPTITLNPEYGKYQSFTKNELNQLADEIFRPHIDFVGVR